MITDSFFSKRIAQSIERYLREVSADVREAVKFTVIPSDTSSQFVKVQYDDRFIVTLLTIAFYAGNSHGYNRASNPDSVN